MKANSNNDRYQQHPLPDDFPISSLGTYRENIIAPSGAFDHQGNWMQTFGIHSTGTGNSRVGTLVLKRRVGPEGRASISVRHDKLLSGSTMVRKGGPQRSHRVLEAVMHLGAGDTPLSTPRRWSFHARVLDAHGTVILDATLRRRAVVEDGKLRITTGEDPPRDHPLAGAYTVNWALFDAVGRLPRKSFDPICFTLVDHFDQIKPRQELVFRRAIDTQIARQTVRLFGFDQTGCGVMPWTYWVDRQGRAVVVISGLETYILESVA